MTKQSDDTKFFVWLTVGAVAFILGMAALMQFQAAQRAAAYERVTGKHVTAKDAMFLDLRIQEPVKP